MCSSHKRRGPYCLLDAYHKFYAMLNIYLPNVDTRKLDQFLFHKRLCVLHMICIFVSLSSNLRFNKSILDAILPTEHPYNLCLFEATVIVRLSCHQRPLLHRLGILFKDSKSVFDLYNVK